MSVISDFFVSDDENFEKFDLEREEFDPDDIFLSNGFTTLELSFLLSVVYGKEWDNELSDLFKMVMTRDAGERVIHKFPSDFVKKLSELDDCKIVSNNFSRMEDMYFTANDLLPVVEGLKKLSKNAVDSNQNLYVWNCV